MATSMFIPSIPLYHHVICFKGLPSGKPTVRYGKSPLFIYIYISTISMAIFQFANRNKLPEGNPMVYHGFPYRRMVITYPIVPQMDHKWTTIVPPLYHHCTTIVPFLLYHHCTTIVPFLLYHIKHT